MAYTSTPEIQTYTTESIPAFYNIDIPNGISFTSNENQCPGCRNLVPFILGDNEMAEIRLGINGRDVTDNTANFVCRGMYVWEKTIGTIYYFVVVSDVTNLTSKVYSSTDATTWTAVNTLTNYALTPVRFTEFLDDTNTRKLVMVDGIEGYVFTSNLAGTKITDVDFPSPHIPFPVFVDGYLFLAKANTGDIYNSDLNDPAIWTAGSFITAEMYPDDIQALIKIDNYIVAVGTQSCEYFYDAANATGSPLARLEGVTLSFGTPFPNSIAYSHDTIIMLANSNDGAATLQLIQGTKTEQLPCPWIESLQYELNNTAVDASKLRAWFFRQNGSLYYVFNWNAFAQYDFLSNQPSAYVGYQFPTFVYSLDTKKWTEFTKGTNDAIFPVFYSASTTSSNVANYIAGHGIDSSNGARLNVFFGRLVLQVNASDSFYLSDGSLGKILQINTTTRTTPQSFGSLNTKYLLRFGVEYDGWAAGHPLAFTVYWNDIGQYSFSNSASNNGDNVFFGFPFVFQLGSFRRRIFMIKTSWSASYGTTAYPIRINQYEIRLNRGIA